MTNSKCITCVAQNICKEVDCRNVSCKKMQEIYKTIELEVCSKQRSIKLSE